MQRAVLIAGPTTSGKTDISLRLARQVGGWVINADSMQIYRDLRVVTARPTEAQRAGIPHRLFGTVDGSEAFSAAQYAAAAGRAIAAADAAGAVPILVGGTGFYFTALTEGLADIPPIPAAVRQTVRQVLATHGSERLHATLAIEDPAAAGRLAPGDSQRIARALEVVRGTGRPLDAWQADHRPGPLAGRPLVRAVLTLPRDALRARIDRRFRAMVEQGALEEVAALQARHLDPSLPVMKALGVPPLIEHLASRLDLETAIARAVTQTRQYAKRQDTWFRNRFDDWPRYDPRCPDETVAALLAHLHGDTR